MTRLFTAHTWHGGFYELELELGDRDDARLIASLHALWDHPTIEGCFLNPEQEPSEQARIPFDAKLLAHGHLYGLARLPGDRLVPCGSFVSREDGGSDWLGFYLPMGALERVFPVHAFPLDTRDHESWRSVVDDWLASIGRSLFGQVAFRLGLVGFEVSSELCAAEIERTGVPDCRSEVLLLPQAGLLTCLPRTTE